jgi:hypothetical protein
MVIVYDANEQSILIGAFFCFSTRCRRTTNKTPAVSGGVLTANCAE